MRKKIISLLMVIAMTLTCASCDMSGSGGSAPAGGGEETSEQTESQQLEVLRTDLNFTQDQELSRIKAEYLIENQGYSDDDEVVAILSLGEDALADSYLAGNYGGSFSEYAASLDGKNQAEFLTSRQDKLVSKLVCEGLISDVEYRYTALVNAVAVKTTYGAFCEMEKLVGSAITKATLSDTYNRPQESSADDASAIVNPVEVYETGIYDPSAVDYTGKRTAVAILDSGFDLSHSVFQRELQSDELLFTRQTIGEALAVTEDSADKKVLNAVKTTPSLTVSDVYYSDKIPFKYDYGEKDNDVFPHDSEHGTHVAGIIGGWDEARGHKGIAPDTQLVLMKVFPDINDGAETDDILAALQDAVVLGVDAINMSLGSACGFAREADGDLINTVYDKINEMGISCLTAASNSYSSGFGGAQGNTNLVTNPDSGTVGSPSTYAPSLSVASISGTKSKYLVTDQGHVFFYDESNSMAGEPNDFYAELYKSLGKDTSETLTLEYVTIPGVGRAADFASAGNIQGKIALIQRGDTTFEEKAQRAKNAGAAACIIYNNIDGDILMSMGKSDHIPTISISKDDGTILAARDSGTITLDPKHEAGPFMSDFSSWGPMPDLGLKPEITAHGGNIRSSVPGNTFDEISGTSMATPNLCGIVVLIRQYLKEKFPTKEPTEISKLTNQLLMSTAGIILNEEGVPYSPRKQGAGLASIGNVVNTRAYLTVDNSDRTKLELKDDPQKKGIYNMVFNVVNLSGDELKYDLSLIGMTESVSTSDSSHVAETGDILDGTFTASATGDGNVAGNLVTVSANGTLKLNVTYTLTQDDKDKIERLFPYGMYVEGFVKLEAREDDDNTKDDIDLNIPFLAFYGDWTQAPLFDKTYFEVESEAHDMSIDEEDKLKADYYATTPYGSFANNYIIPLGTYLYDIDESAYDAIPATEDHIAISDIFYSIDGISTVYAGLLRNAKTLTYTITDKVTGEQMFYKEVTNAHKAFSQGGSPIPNYEDLAIRTAQTKLVNNRRYEFKMTGLLDYKDGGLKTNVRNTFSFDFYVDNEAPVIREAVYEKEYDRNEKKYRYYVTLTIYDNHYVQSLQPIRFTPGDTSGETSYTALEENPIPVYSERGTDNKMRIEITKYLEDAFYDYSATNMLGFIVDDYAINTDAFICQLPGTDPGTSGSMSFTMDGTPGGGRRQRVVVSQNSVMDLTQYLAITDEHANEDRDFLPYLRWTSNNENVAKVDRGQVLGVAPGLAQITVSNTIYTPAPSATINVLVQAGSVSAASSEISTVAANVDNVGNESLESVRFTYFDTLFAHLGAGEVSQIGETGDRRFLNSVNGSLQMYPGEKIKLSYEILPWYVRDRYPATYSTSNESAATVEQDGTVTAKAEGSAVIRLNVQGSTQSAVLRITVKSPFVIDDARTLVSYKGVDKRVEIPDDEGILYIGPYAFSLYTLDNNIVIDDDDFYANRKPSGNSYIEEVIIPEGVQEIQRHAFYNCPNLKKVTIPSSCKFIREYCFYDNVKLAEINLYEDKAEGDDVWIQAIGAYAFRGCKALNNINIAKTYALGEGAFEGCTSLTSVDLSGLRNAGKEVFKGCTSLSEVTFDSNGDTKLSEGMFRGAGLSSVSVYEKITVPAYCFADNASLGSVTFFNAPELVGEGAFMGCTSLTSLTLPNGETQLGDFAFDGCSTLATVTFQPNTKIATEAFKTGGAVFGNTKITSFVVQSGNNDYKASSDNALLLSGDGKTVILAATGHMFGDYTLPAEYTKVGESAFAGTDISKLTIQNKDLEIGAYAFAECPSLAEVVFPSESGALKIGDYAFSTVIFDEAQNKYVMPSVLATVTNLDKVKTVGKYAFARIAATGIVLGEGATFDEGAFFNSSLENVMIGKNSSFGFGAFQNCLSLKTVTIADGTGVSFGLACFSRDSKLSTIDLSKISKIADECFSGCTSLTVADLSAATEIGKYAFYRCSSLTTLTLGNNLTAIGDFAFSGDATLIIGGTAPASADGLPIAALNLPASLESIGEGAFIGCYKITSVNIPDGIEEIPDYAFARCVALNNVKLADTVVKIGRYAFVACESLEQIDLSKVKEFGDYAFISDYGLKTIALTAAEKVGVGAFADCTYLACEISAPKLTEIGDYGFQASKITKFDAPALKKIGIGAFQLSSLTGFNFGSGLESVGYSAFANCASLKSFTFGSGNSANGEINSYAFLENGVLYTRLPNGKIQLAAVPGGSTASTLTVKEGTYRIDTYAGSANPYISVVVLPDSLRVIGNYAFYGYSALKTVEFRSIEAPALENSYDSSAYLSETDPGYDVLHGIISGMDSQLCYYNFVDLVGKKAPIQMLLPVNLNISGYDSMIYEGYFGKAAAAQRSSYTAMELNLRNFIEYAEALVDMTDVTFDDEELIVDAATAYNGITQNYKDYGITDEQWNSYTEALTKTSAALKELKLSNASRTAREIQARIDALPDTFDGSQAQRDVFDQLRRDVNLLTRRDREALDLTRYNAFRTSMDSYDPEGGSGQQDPEVGPAPAAGGGCKGGCGSTSTGEGTVIFASSLLGLALLFTVSRVLRRKRR